MLLCATILLQLTKIRLDNQQFAFTLVFSQVFLQVVDDILDVTKSSHVLGKTVGKDFVAYKVTYPKCLDIPKSKDFVAKLIKDAHG
ncbi:hypothetical protein RIF29_15181 [Crotalaria pallida]|uniref:Uncharacterized protein n=1 Tax=Crotalaria pallida TaxID=3830 RepID=A0AAN9FCP8_CROPI